MSGPKKTMTKQQSFVVMIIGGILFVLALVIPTEPGSSAQLWKVLMGFIGFCIVGFGSYFRPMKPGVEAEQK